MGLSLVLGIELKTQLKIGSIVLTVPGTYSRRLSEGKHIRTRFDEIALFKLQFDYSLFTVANVSENSLGLVQRIQNRAIRCIYRHDWDSPTKDLFQISKERLLQLGARYLIKAIRNKNAFICPLISEYIRSWSAITARYHEMSTPLCFLASLISLSFACIVFIVMGVFCYFIFYE